MTVNVLGRQLPAAATYIAALTAMPTRLLLKPYSQLGSKIRAVLDE